MPALKPSAASSSSSASTSTSGGKKRRYRFRNQQSKRRQTASESRSPATNPKFEAKGKAAQSYAGKRGGGNSRPYQPKDRKPFSQGKQSKGGSQ